MDLIEIVKRALGEDCVLLDEPQRILGGLTNENWLVRTTDKTVVIRIGNPHSADLQIDRQSEIAVLAATAREGLSAQLLFALPEQHVIVTEHLPGRVWGPRDARQPDNIERLALLLRRLHSLPPPVGAQTVNLRAVVCGYWNTLMARGLSARAGSAELRDRVRNLVTALASDAQVCLCHNDIHHLNVIDDGELRLVDWEYSGIGDPHFDLASVCCYHAFSDTARASLLRAYLGTDNRAALERLHRMCWLFDYIRELWFAVREMR